MPYMKCPRCGLSLRLRADYLAVDRCPRCIAKARVSVRMLWADSPPEVRGGLVVTTRRDGGSIVLVLTGELDLASAPMLERHLDDADATGIGRVVVDLSGLEFLDSSGLQLLLRARTRLRGRRQELFLRPGPRAVQQVFEVTHTAALFRFED